MKKITALVLAMLLLTGCGKRSAPPRDPVLFCYPRAEMELGEPNGALYFEEREAAGHLKQLQYLLTLYLTGPTDETMVCLFPEDTRVLHAQLLEKLIYIRLSDSLEEMDEKTFTLASSCMAITCFSLTDAETVILRSGARSITLNRESFLLTDEFRS